MKQHLISWYKTYLAAMNLRKAYGHGLSTKLRAAVGARGEPIPWYTYPAIEFLSSLSFVGKHVHEHGVGNSTLWWRYRTNKLTGVEHDKDCAAKHSVPWTPAQNAYVESKGDIQIIDGLWRTECAQCVNTKRVELVILDNSDWYPDAHAQLTFKFPHAIHLHGFGPINAYTWTTSIYFSRLPSSHMSPLEPSLASVKP